jgi:hypothetical protein
MAAESFEGWAIIEFMGHVRIAGYVKPEEHYGAPMIRVDTPGEGDKTSTQLYAPGALYCITPVSEEVARHASQSMRRAPLNQWDLQLLPPPVVTSDSEEY